MKAEPILGEWWLAEIPDAHHAGFVTRDADQWKLELIGSMDAEDKLSFTDGLSESKPAVIHGASHGYSYTLLHSFLSQTYGPAVIPNALPFDSHTGPMQYTETWHSYQLLKGSLVTPLTQYAWASFGLTAASEWWASAFGLTPPETGQYDFPDPLLAEWNGFKIAMYVGVTRHRSRRLKSIAESVRFEVRKKTGFELGELEIKICNPLKVLLAIVFDRDIEVFDVNLHARDAAPGYTTIEVDPGLENADSVERVAQYDALVQAEALDFSVFVPGWLAVAERIGDPIYIAENQSSVRGYLQSQTLAVLGALESVHRSLFPNSTAELSAGKEERQRKLKAAGFNSKDRRRIERAIFLAESAVTLERRLEELLNVLGEHFADWFFNGKRKEWCLVTAFVRNLLAHGGTSATGAHSDVRLMIAVLQTGLRILRLLLLVEAGGLPSGDPLVQIALKNHDLMYVLKQDLADWGEWAARLRDAGAQD